MDQQHILILGGSPKEIIDNVRHYANHSHPENLGAETAKLLAAQGAKVTLIAPEMRALPEGVNVISNRPDGQPIISGRDLVEAAEHFAKQNTAISAVLQLANASSIRPVKTETQKIKAKTAAGAVKSTEVLGNVDVWSRLEAAFPDIPLVGYYHQQLTATADNSITHSLRSFIERSQSQKPAPAPANTGIPAGNELAGRNIIVSSGPTVETLTQQGDVITNFSSGKQGHAIAEALANMGAKVTLVTGPVKLPDPTHPNIITLHAASTMDMLGKVVASLPADAYLGVAAVADYGMEHPIDLRLKDGEPYTLPLVQKPDILETVSKHPTLRPKAVIGFAAETDREKLLTYARGKLEKKGPDAICANEVGPVIAERGSNKNQITWVNSDGNDPWKPMDKYAIGQAIGKKLAGMLAQKKAIGL